jgi:hypothetical protein
MRSSIGARVRDAQATSTIESTATAPRRSERRVLGGGVVTWRIGEKRFAVCRPLL